MASPAHIASDLIRRDGGTQMRIGINEDAVDSYAERMEAGDVFPPVVVFYDGAAHWLADGFHRLAARARVAAKHIGTDNYATWCEAEADLRAGTRQDAIRFAIAANRANGLRRTNADKQVAVRAALAHPDMKGMSDRAIASEVGVNDTTVAKHRQVQDSCTSTQTPASTHKAVSTATDKRLGTDGKSYPVRPKPQQDKPRAPSRQPEAKRDAARVVVEQRASTGVARKHICPTCNGEGYIE